MTRRRSSRAYQISYFVGLLAELLIFLIYAMRGWRLVKWRHRSAFGEIDLILQKQTIICFVEVKYRRQYSYDLHPIHQRDLQRLRRAGTAAYAKYGKNRAAQFDIMILSGWGRIHAYPNHVTLPISGIDDSL